MYIIMAEEITPVVEVIEEIPVEKLVVVPPVAPIAPVAPVTPAKPVELPADPAPPRRDLAANDEIALLRAEVAAMQAKTVANEAKAIELETGKQELIRDKQFATAIDKTKVIGGLIKDALTAKAKLGADGVWAIAMDGKDLSIEGAIKAYATKYPQVVQNGGTNVFNKVNQKTNQPTDGGFAARLIQPRP